MGKLQGTSEGSSCFKTRLLSSIQTKTTTDPVSGNQKQLYGSSKTESFTGSGSTNGSKKGSGSGSKQELSRILQSFVSGSKTRKQMAASYRSQCGKYVLACSHLQNGNRGSHSGFSSIRGVGGFDRLNRRLLPCTHTSQVSEISSLSCGGSGLPIQSPTLRDRHCSIGVHSSSERSQVHSSFTRGSNPSVFGRLASKSQRSGLLRSRCSKIDHSGRKIGLDCQFEKIRAQSHSGSRISGLSLQSSRGFGLPKSKEIGQAQNFGSFHFARSQHYSKEAHVTNWGHGFHGENSSFGSDPYETVSVVSEDQLAVSPVIGQGGPNFSVDKGPSGLVDGSSELTQGFESASERTQHSDVHRCIREGLGGSLEQLYCKWVLAAIRKRLPYQYFGTESCFSSSETFSRTIKAKNSVGFFRQLNCGLLYQQRRRHSLRRNVCFDVENSGLVQCQGDPDQGQTYSRESQCDSRFPVQEGQGHSDRVVFASSGLSRNLPSLAQANGGSVCHQLECQASNLRISCPRRQGLADRCIEHLLGGSGRLCFLSSSHPSSVSSENDHLQVQGHCDSTRVAGDALVLGSGRIVSQDSTEASSNAQSPEATLQSQIPQESGVSEPPCLVSGLLQEGQGGFSVEVADRIKAPQRQSSRRVYDSRWAIFQKWAQENQVDVTKPTIPQIADFLNHLFTDRNLKPRTIAGYRTSVADGLGSAGQMVSQSLDLNRLIASFHRDRPSANRSIPNWDLSLVLLALTRAPFEPLGKADLKILTFKTVFLLALASGKRRSEIHAWTFDSFSRKRDWSQVTFSPSTAFIAKNQLASEGPLAIQPVVIPALKPTLDPSLIQDKSLCPVRALRYYLDKTKDLRKGKKLLFVAIKEGYSKDISKATISSWIKQSIILAYQKSDQEVQNVSQVKAHEVRALAASLAFKGGVAVDEIMASCFWRSHSTFTNFYLKDLCWHNGDVMKIGPVVAAQHVVNC